MLRPLLRNNTTSNSERSEESQSSTPRPCHCEASRTNFKLNIAAIVNCLILGNWSKHASTLRLLR